MLLAAGTPPAKIYEALQKDAKGPRPFERILVAAPPKDAPSKGAKAGAKVTVQMFGDFECPFTQRVQATIDELIAAFPGKVRVVWRHNPLPFHKNAEVAAEASVEVLKQKGEAGFWAFAKRVFEAQTPGLSREAIEKAAEGAGADVVKLRAALDSGAHKAAVAADKKLAESVFITATPAFAINDYFVAGAQPFPKFKRIVQKALGPYEAPAPGSLHTAALPPPSPSPSPSAAPTPGPGTRVMLGAKHILIMYAGSRRAPASVTRTKDEARALAAEAL
jgi:protein-disulfide isomerase